MTGSVAIAISAFRSDAQVIALLEALHAEPHPEAGPVIVVDSLGSGEIATTASARGWVVHYENADTNLGSAGNLARRMELAAQAGAEWCLCMNHDANWDADRLTAMLSLARSRARVGAVYPVLDHSPREPRWEEGRRRFTPYVSTRVSTLPAGDTGAEVLWSSSNSALYATRPLAEGIAVMGDLWMGYEDLGYGIALHRGGWAQLVCRAAILGRVFDYGSRRILGREVQVPEKPVWYAYYNLRNLILIRRRYGARGIPLSSIFGKLLHSSFRIMLFEKNKATRLHMLYLGAIAGLIGRSGKGPWP